VIFSKQLNSSSFTVPPDVARRRTSELLDNGLISIGAGPGLVAYSSLGTQILQRVERLVIDELADVGYHQVQLPHIMSDDDLRSGQDVGEQFLSKVMRVHESIPDHHLITSPETLLARLAGRFEISYRTLPIRLSYATSIFRKMPETRSFLTCREFKVVGAVALLPHEATLEDVVAELDAVRGAFGRAGATLSTPLVELRSGTASELGHVSVEGDVRASVAGVVTTVLSISVGYDYSRDLTFPMAYRTADNRLRDPQVTSLALCTNRLMYACFDSVRDELGFALPPAVRPFDIVVVPRSRGELDQVENMAHRARERGLRVGIDDRVNRRVGMRIAFASYIGVPATALVHRDLAVVTARGQSPDFGTATPESADVWIDEATVLARPR
jgi:prolyl-tRNA synthetase